MPSPGFVHSRSDAGAGGAVVVIPARLASTRFPRKMIVADTGRPLVQHVVDRCRDAAGVRDVIVAVDDERVAAALEPFGTRTVLTSPACRTGTERVAEAARSLGLDVADLVVNVQGDEPEIDPGIIASLVERMADGDAAMGTVHVPFPSGEAVGDANLVKVVASVDGRDCLWFSRSPIPHARQGEPAYRLHVGIYAYRVAALLDLAATPPTPCELAESLEQLRALETGRRIAAVAAEGHRGGIDTEEQYRAFAARHAAATSAGKLL